MQAFNLWHPLNARHDIANDAASQPFPHTHTHKHTHYFCDSQHHISQHFNGYQLTQPPWGIIRTRITVNLITFYCKRESTCIFHELWSLILVFHTDSLGPPAAYEFVWSRTVCGFVLMIFENRPRHFWCASSRGNASDIDVVIFWMFCAKRTFDSI